MKNNKTFLLICMSALMLFFASCSSDNSSDNGKTGNIEIKALPQSRVISFFISSTSPISINWGDGTEEVRESGTRMTLSHRYAESDLMTINISSAGITELSFTIYGEFRIGSFTSLKFNECTKLKEVNCWNSTLQTLEFSKCDKIEVLECSNNQLTELDIRSLKNLITLSCGQNKLKSLDATNCKKLTEIVCPFNGMKELQIEGLPDLAMLFCDNNDLASLSVKGDKNLWYIECYNNNLNGGAINALFESLPKVEPKPIEEREFGIIKLNLNGNGINTTIASNKNWIVNDFPAFRVLY